LLDISKREKKYRGKQATWEEKIKLCCMLLMVSTIYELRELLKGNKTLNETSSRKLKCKFTKSDQKIVYW
jgi:hypothetical protein